MDYVMTFSHMYNVVLSYQPQCLSNPRPLLLLPAFSITDSLCTIRSFFCDTIVFNHIAY